jgi:hypothetical protein
VATPRIVIHIGAPKTGSSTLQRLVRTEPDVWRAHGVHMPILPEVERQAGNAMLLAASLGAETAGMRRGFPEIDPAALDPAELVARLLAGWRPEREVLVLSAVHFEAAQAKPLREVLPHDVACTVVFFVRNQCRWLESYHRQLVKTMLFEAVVSELVAAVLDPAPGPRYCPDWMGIYEAWQDAFGDCRVVVFEDAAADLLGAFAAAAGLAQPLPSIPALEPQNVSPDAFQIAYLLGLDRPVELADFRQRRAAATEAADRSSVPSLGYLTREDRERLRDRFEPGNRRLLELLGRPYDGSPLDLSSVDGDHAELGDVYRSRSYRSYRKLADRLYAKAAS